MQEKIVYAYVVADLLHIGHIIHLENAKSFGDKLVVGVLTDEATMEKKPKPILSFSERIRLVKALKCVDMVVAQKTYSPIPNIKSLKPDILIESDGHDKRDLENTKLIASSIGCTMIILPYYSEQSSSKIKDDILKSWKSPYSITNEIKIKEAEKDGGFK